MEPRHPLRHFTRLVHCLDGEGKLLIRVSKCLDLPAPESKEWYRLLSTSFVCPTLTFTVLSPFDIWGLLSTFGSRYRSHHDTTCTALIVYILRHFRILHTSYQLYEPSHPRPRQHIRISFRDVQSSQRVQDGLLILDRSWRSSGISKE